ncbi:hypothetical protein V1477_017026 [Vespula maculifrons]|uniref:Uncharacterized protein n=1 Tax=Vespula maculifrons TaxID=7453 RepID=A0ABD2B4W5_VESMC
MGKRKTQYPVTVVLVIRESLFSFLIHIYVWHNLCNILCFSLLTTRR